MNNSSDILEMMKEINAQREERKKEINRITNNYLDMDVDYDVDDHALFVNINHINKNLSRQLYEKYNAIVIGHPYMEEDDCLVVDRNKFKLDEKIGGINL